MKIRSLSIFIISFITVMAFISCASSKETSNMKELVGQVVVVGNEPFTNLALQINPSINYILECNGKTKDILLGNQGKWVKIFYNKIDNSNNINTIEVQKAEILTRK